MRDNISRRLKRDIAPLLLLLVGIAGCRDQKPVEEQADISVTVSIPDSGPIDGLDAPAPLVVMGGCDNPAKWITGMLQWSSKGPAPIQKAQLDTALQTELDLKQLDAVDLQRPARFAAFATESAAFDTVALFGVVSDKRLRSSLAGKSVKDDEHGIVRYGNLSPKFVMPLGRFAAFSRSKKLLTEHRDFLIKLYGAQTGPSLRTHIAGTKKLQRYARLASTKARSRLGGAERAIEALTSVAEDVDSLLLDITMSPRTADLRLEVRVAKQHRRLLAALAKQRLELPLVGVGAELARLRLRLAPAMHESWTKHVVSLASSPQTEADTTKKEGRAMVRFWKATTGEIALVLSPRPAPHGSGIVGQIGIRKPRAAQRALNDLFALGRQHAGGTYETKAYRIGNVDVARVQFGDEHAEQVRGSSWQSLLNYDIALHKDRALIAYGSGRDVALTSMLARETREASDDKANATKSAPSTCSRSFATLEVAAVKALGALQSPGLEAIAAAARNIKASPTRITLCATADNETLSLSLSVPVEQMEELTVLSRAAP